MSKSLVTKSKFDFYKKNAGQIHFRSFVCLSIGVCFMSGSDFGSTTAFAERNMMS